MNRNFTKRMQEKLNELKNSNEPQPIRSDGAGGWAREITSRELPVDKILAIVNMNLSPGVREMHSHLQSEWGYVLEGGARVTAVDERGRTFIADCEPGEGWIFPANVPHSIQGLHDGCGFLMIFDNCKKSTLQGSKRALILFRSCTQTKCGNDHRITAALGKHW